MMKNSEYRPHMRLIRQTTIYDDGIPSDRLVVRYIEPLPDDPKAGEVFLGEVFESSGYLDHLIGMRIKFALSKFELLLDAVPPLPVPPWAKKVIHDEGDDEG